MPLGAQIHMPQWVPGWSGQCVVPNIAGGRSLLDVPPSVMKARERYQRYARARAHGLSCVMGDLSVARTFGGRLEAEVVNGRPPGRESWEQTSGSRVSTSLGQVCL